ncbi:MAG: GDSL-type esterase/lipase family protein [Gammaproteobacteria bacterium]|nr:GDSL-type esterase/lipase family protein [Gammaproteobacteria bacterium]
MKNGHQSRLTRLSTIWVLCWGLLACGSEQPALSPLGADAKILAFGDSLTKGTGGGEANYPATLSRLGGREVVNAGIPGELSGAGLKRLPRVLDATQPQLLILCHGGNDMLRKKNLKTAANNIRAMVELAQARNVQVLLVGVPKPGLLLGTASFYSDVAAATGIPAEHEILADILSSPGLKSDAIHPNGKGYERMAEAIYEVLKDAGAL